MALLMQNVWDMALAALDAQGSDRYIWERDGIFAAAYANQMTVNIINAAYSDTKMPAEALKELARVRIWQTSDYARLAYDPTALNGEKLWTILSVHPEVVTVEPPTIDPSVTGANSKVRLDLTFRSSIYSARRATFEEYNINQRNPFLPGNTLVQNWFAEYTYLDWANYQSNNYNPNGTFEIEIRGPQSASRKLVGVRYFKQPTNPTFLTDSVEFPEFLLTFYVELLLRFVSFKQGDNTTLYSVTERDIAAITSLLSK